jgi:transposase
MLDAVLVGRIQERKSCGYSISEIAKHFDLHRTTVSLALERTTHERKGRDTSGTIAARRRLLKLMSKKCIFVNTRKTPRYGTARALVAGLATEHGIRVSCATVVRDMRALGLKSFVRRAVPALGKAHHEKRLAFCKKWVGVSCKRMVFSDEHWENTNDSTQRTMYAQSKRFVLTRLQKNRLCVPRVMIWGAIGYNWKSPLVFVKDAGPGVQKLGEADETRNVTAARYVRTCLSRIVPALQGANRIFMQDGAKAHTARSTARYLEKKGVRVMEGWPSHSPDLNPIEKLWSIVKKRVSDKAPITLSQLKTAVSQVWDEIPMSTINNLVCGFHKKCEECIARNGAC